MKLDALQIDVLDFVNKVLEAICINARMLVETVIKMESSFYGEGTQNVRGEFLVYFWQPYCLFAQICYLVVLFLRHRNIFCFYET